MAGGKQEPFTAEERLHAELFMPFALDRVEEIARTAGRFVHYTSAGTAMEIIQSERIWMRNSMTMNDFSEVAHGRNCLFPAYANPQIGGRLKALIEQIYPGSSSKLADLFNGWLPHFEQETYLTSLSEHDPSEDELGRLSMWRAYCPRNGVALVIRNHPFMASTDALQAFSSPVAYLSPSAFSEAFAAIVTKMESRIDFLKSYEEQKLISSVFWMLKFALICTKHPGFKEEREWRVIYSPTQSASKVIEKAFATVEGVPQEIHKIPLKDDPENGLHGADINSLLDRVIIGPSPQPFTIWRAFVELLRSKGVDQPESRVVASDIPLRTN